MSERSPGGPEVRVVLRPGRPRGWAGWWPLPAGLAVLLLLVLVAPSRPAADAVATGRGGADGPVAAGGLSPVGGPGAGDADRPVATTPDGGVVPGAPGATPTSPSDPAATGGGPGDRSHCTADGRQDGVVFQAPPCVARFVGDNGGATAPGVTATTVRVAAFLLRCDPTTEALLRSLGFQVASCDQQRAMMQAAVAHLNQRLELYGRHVELTVHFGDCPFPEDLDTCLGDARAVIATHPFAVVTTFAGTYQAVWEEFARSGVVLVGGGSLATGEYLEHSPFWWSREMSSTQQADLVSDWWCSTMAGRPADHTGPVIHRSIGRRGSVVRRAGLVYYDAPAGREAARRITDALAACGTEVTSFAYIADAAVIQQQSLAAIARFIADDVTSILWFDFLAPTFVAPELTRQGYFPEHIIAGASGSTSDASHRTIDPQQWKHAFGVFPEPAALPPDDGEGAAVLRDGGWRGAIPPFPESYTQGLLLLGNLLQAAGPHLTPEGLRAVELQPRRGGDGSGDASGPREGVSFSARDHNGIDDVREVYWDPRAVSASDGGTGALLNADGGARRRIGGPWAGPDAVPVAP